MTARSAAWLLGSGATIAVVQLGSAAVLGRLLDPRDFGVVALAGIVLRLVSYFSQMGISNAVVQRPDVDTYQLAKLQHIGLGVGTVAFAVGTALSPLAAVLVHDSRATGLTALMCLTFIPTGSAAAATGYLRRTHDFRSIAVAESTGYIVGYFATSVLCAVCGLGALSLVIGVIAQSAVVASLVLVRAGIPIRPGAATQPVLPFLKFGGNVSLIGFISFWGLQVDTIAVSHYGGAAALGQYTRANAITSPPLSMFTQALTRVFGASFSRIAEIGRARVAFRDCIVAVGTPVALAAAFAGVNASAIVRILLGDRWGSAAGVLPILAACAGFQALTMVAETFVEARGFLSASLRIQSLTLAVFIAAAVAVGSGHPSLRAFALCWLGTEFLRHALYMVSVTVRTGDRFSSVVRLYRDPLIAAALTVVAGWVSSHVISLDASAPRDALVLVGGAAGAAAACGLLCLAGFRWDVMSIARARGLRRRRGRHAAWATD